MIYVKTQPVPKKVCRIVKTTKRYAMKSVNSLALALAFALNTSAAKCTNGYKNGTRTVSF